LGIDETAARLMVESQKVFADEGGDFDCHRPADGM